MVCVVKSSLLDSFTPSPDFSTVPEQEIILFVKVKMRYRDGEILFPKYPLILDFPPADALYYNKYPETPYNISLTGWSVCRDNLQIKQ